MVDAFDSEIFVAAQDPIIEQVQAELRNGCKTSHWMWFIFPQLRVLGRSETARRFGLASRAQAQAYMEHPVLGQRLRDCTALVLAVEGRTAHDIFGSPDDFKLRSCMTLFALAWPDEPVFKAVLEKYYAGEADSLTLQAAAEA